MLHVDVREFLWTTCCLCIPFSIPPTFYFQWSFILNTMQTRNNNSNYNAAVTIRSCAIFFSNAKETTTNTLQRHGMARTFHRLQVDIGLHFYGKDMVTEKIMKRTSYMCAIFFSLVTKIRKRIVKRCNFWAFFYE